MNEFEARCADSGSVFTKRKCILSACERVDRMGLQERLQLVRVIDHVLARR
jgi:hypothetical protein